MSELHFLSDYFRRLPASIGSMLSARLQPQHFQNDRQDENELTICPRHRLCFKKLPLGIQVSLRAKEQDGNLTKIPLFDESLVDFDIRRSLLKPCAEIIFFDSGKIRIQSAESFSQKLSWCAKKGATSAQIVQLIETFSLSLSQRPGEVELETFGPSKSFAQWKSLKQNDSEKNKLGFFTLKSTETCELIVDALKQQRLASWRHWSGSQEGEVRAVEILKKFKVFFLSHTTPALDMAAGFVAQDERASLKMLGEIEAWSGQGYLKNEVILAHFESLAKV